MMAILAWDLILIPWMMGTAAVLVTVGLVGLRTHRAGLDRAPEGTVVALMVVGLVTAMVTALVMVVLRMGIMEETMVLRLNQIEADLRATTASATETKMPPGIPAETTTPRTTPAEGQIRLTATMPEARGTGKVITSD